MTAGRRPPARAVAEPVRAAAAPAVIVPWPSPLTPVIVVRRLNRFAVEAAVAAAGPDGRAGLQASGRASGTPPAVAPGTVLRLHLPNSGRMAELLQPGTPGLAWIPPGATGAPADPPGASPGPAGAAGEGRDPAPPGASPGAAGSRRQGSPVSRPPHPAPRRTAGDLLLVRDQERWVSVDARMPNRLFAAALDRRALPPFAAYRRWRAEVAWGAGRLDFCLDQADPPAPPCLVETKSCNLVEGATALFPDAPTARGARHLEELAAAVRQGYRAAVVWFVQRDDAAGLAPHRRADPAFAAALSRARAAGVEAYAYRCRVTPAAITVLDSIPVVEA
ncbi:DNA/RNA nuclease SfsA [Thermaerobacter litoralis]